METNINMNRLQFLKQLGDDMGTDKLSHGYLDHYAKHLPEEPKYLLEIGCYKGQSLKMWKEFYKDKTDIHVIDLFQEKGLFTPAQCRASNFVPYQGDQSDIRFLSTITQNFDVIIDDGSHMAAHMIQSFDHLFVNNLHPGGLYVIEDLHCCKQEFYHGLGVDSYEETILYFGLDFEKNKEVPSAFKGLSDATLSLINNITVYDDKIMFIEKK
jgi:hypothetical protein